MASSTFLLLKSKKKTVEKIKAQLSLYGSSKIPNIILVVYRRSFSSVGHACFIKDVLFNLKCQLLWIFLELLFIEFLLCHRDIDSENK